jgi:RHS repeat-associated protein
MRRYLLTLLAVGLWPTLTFAQTSTQVVEYYHTDALGSVRAVTKVVNGQTQVVSRHDYRPFGEEVAPQTPPVDKRLFTGKERDQETGWDYFEARYYCSNHGRFGNPDPLMSTGRAADPQSWNRYTYGLGNPLRFVDPSGMEAVVRGDVEEVQRWLRNGVGKEAAQYVFVEWDPKNDRWHVAIKGIDIDEFKRMSGGGSDAPLRLANLVQDVREMTIKETKESLPDFNPGYTFDIGERGCSTVPVVMINFDQYLWKKGELSSKMAWERWYDHNADSLAEMSSGMLLFHELGHAWGNMQSRRTALGQTVRDAMDWENAARKAVNPGSPGALRVKHDRKR